MFLNRKFVLELDFRQLRYIRLPKADIGKRYFLKRSLIEAVTFIIKNCFFTIGNIVFKQDIGIPMRIESMHVHNLNSNKSTTSYYILC